MKKILILFLLSIIGCIGCSRDEVAYPLDVGITDISLPQALSMINIEGGKIYIFNSPNDTLKYFFGESVPEIDFNVYSLLVVMGRVTPMVQEVTKQLLQTGPDEYMLNITIRTISGYWGMQVWMAAVLTPKLPDTAKIDYTETIVRKTGPTVFRETIVGVWKLQTYSRRHYMIDHWETVTTDYSQDNITYDFREARKLIITGVVEGDLLTPGEYDYSYGPPLFDDTYYTRNLVINGDLYRCMAFAGADEMEIHDTSTKLFTKTN
jgi:hypothetical protein